MYQVNDTPTSLKETEARADVTKLGIDVHKKLYVVVRQIDGAAPQSPQKFSPEGFLSWVAKQREESERVVSCYEAGCFGYLLHRRLEAMGVENYVVRPHDWDQYGAGVKTDGRDARELCSHLDRFVAGNKRALAPVPIPSEQEEHERSLSRQRDTLAKERKRLQNIGTSNGRYYGIEVPAQWWKPKVFERLKEEVPAFLIEILQEYYQKKAEEAAQSSKATSAE